MVPKLFIDLKKVQKLRVFKSSKINSGKSITLKIAIHKKNIQSGKLKFGVTSLFLEYLMVTNFHKNLRGSGFFCVEMTWNDPVQTSPLGPVT